jgi:hypothetical protein
MAVRLFSPGPYVSSQAENPALTAPRYLLNIPQQTLGSAGIGPVSLGIPTLVNVSFLNSSSSVTVTITLWDQGGTPLTIPLYPNDSILIKKALILQYQVTGNGATIQGILSWPFEVDFGPPPSVAPGGSIEQFPINGTEFAIYEYGSNVYWGSFYNNGQAVCPAGGVLLLNMAFAGGNADPATLTWTVSTTDFSNSATILTVPANASAAGYSFQLPVVAGYYYVLGLNPDTGFWSITTVALIT